MPKDPELFPPRNVEMWQCEGAGRVELADITLGIVNAMGLGEQADLVDSPEDLSAFLNNWLCGPASESASFCRLTAEGLLDSLAWCLAEAEELFAARGEAAPVRPTWRLFAQLLFLSVNYGTPEHEAWARPPCGTGSLVTPGGGAVM